MQLNMFFKWYKRIYGWFAAKFKLRLTHIVKIRKKLIFTYSDNGNEISGKIAVYHINELTEVVPKDKKDFLFDVINEYQVEKLISILNFKKERNLLKDQNDIKNIIDYLEKN